MAVQALRYSDLGACPPKTHVTSALEMASLRGYLTDQPYTAVVACDRQRNCGIDVHCPLMAEN